MLSHGMPARVDSVDVDSPDVALPPLTRRQKLRMVIKVVELRLRFVALLTVTGLVFAYWDTLLNRYEKWMRPGAIVRAAESGFEFYCPMHPHIVQHEPGSCPICGMTLARRRHGEKPVLPAGVTARVELTPSRIEQAGITTSEVGYAPLNQVVTTVGYVAFDERRVASIVSRVPGKSRVEKLLINVTGQDVSAGQLLAEVYSPELSQAIQELLSASRAAVPGVEPQTEFARSLGEDRRELARASTEKLRRWGVTGPQIDEILAKGTADFAFPILAPRSGHVFKKNVVEGQEVPEGYVMFEVIDLDTVWVQAQVYEHQLGLVREGQTAQATVEAFPGETFAGRVEFMQPHLDIATRTVDVRYAIQNTDHRLRPGMFATVTLLAPVASTQGFQESGTASSSARINIRTASMTAAEQKKCPVTAATLGSMGEPIPVELADRKVWTCCAACPPRLKAEPARYLVRLDPSPPGQVLSVPESAVIDTGTRKVVYVESGPGIYEGRAVVLGARSGNRFGVISGLAPGDKVAVAGAFLIDAESRLNPPTTSADSGTLPARAGEAEFSPDAVITPSPHRH